MFNAKFINGNSGISKTSGNPWYSIELIANTVEGGSKVTTLWCTQQAYENSRLIKSMEDCKVATGVNARGQLTVRDIKAGV